MKTIGLIGGLSWESTAVYYRLLNEMARERLGGLSSAELLVWSFDFDRIAALQLAGDWATATDEMVCAARRLEAGGAACLLICANTMHKMAPDIEAAVAPPVLHIVDALAPAIKAAGSRSPLLLATRYTMEQPFYRERLEKRHGIVARVPNDEDRATVHDVIYTELCRGVVSPDSKARYLEIIGREIAAGADSVIFGCTEIGMLLSPDDLTVPAFDTTVLHAAAALDFALTS